MGSKWRTNGALPNERVGQTAYRCPPYVRQMAPILEAFRRQFIRHFVFSNIDPPVNVRRRTRSLAKPGPNWNAKMRRMREMPNFPIMPDKSSPPYEGGGAPASGDGVVLMPTPDRYKIPPNVDNHPAGTAAPQKVHSRQRRRLEEHRR